MLRWSIHGFLILFLCFTGSESVLSQSSRAQPMDLATKGHSPKPVHSAKVLMEHPEIFLQSYVQIESVTGNEKPAGSYLAHVLDEMGLYVELLGDRDSNFNVAASIYPLSSGKPNLVLLSHIDVVEAGPAAHWTHPPFSGHIADGYVWGRGAYDNKASTIMQSVAASRFIAEMEGRDLPYNITILAVSGEETDSYYGAPYVADHYLEYLNPVLVLGEGPPGVRDVLENHPDRLIFPLAIANKRELWVTLRLAVDSHGHGSIRPERYAIQEMIRALERITQHQSRIQFNPVNRKTYRQFGKLEGGLKGFVLRNLRFFKPVAAGQLRNEPVIEAMFTNSITITELMTVAEGDRAHNVIPQVVEAYLDCRLLPGVSNRQFIRKLRRILNNPDIEIEVYKETPEVKPTLNDYFLEMAEASIVQTYPEASTIPILSPTGSDCNYFRYYQIPVISFMPSEVSHEVLESIHAVNEKFPVESLEPGIATYLAFFTRFMGSDIPQKQQHNRITHQHENPIDE